MPGWHHWLNGHEFEWTPGVGDGRGGLMCCDSWGHKDGQVWATKLNWTEDSYKLWMMITVRKIRILEHHNHFNCETLPTRFLSVYCLYVFTELFLSFSSYVMSDSLQPHELQHARLSCPSLFPGACSNSCPLSRWCHPAIPSSVTPFSSPQFFPASGFFSNELTLCTRWLKYWSFSFNISPSNEYSGLIFFRIDWFDLLVQGILKSLL